MSDSSEMREPAPAYGAVPKGAVPEPWSHPWLDELGLRYHQAIAEKIRREPGLLEIARENLRRWLTAEPEATPSHARREWQRILAFEDVPEIIRAMTDPSEEGHRRRQSTPFPDILSNEERRAIRDQLL